MPDYEDILYRDLSAFTEMMAGSDYAPLIQRDLCTRIINRYRIALHPRVFMYTLMRSGRFGCENARAVVRSVQAYCHIRFEKPFADLGDTQKEAVCGLFVMEYVPKVMATLRMKLQVLLETEFIKRVDVVHLTDPSVSVLHRNTVWHDFATAVQEGLRAVHTEIYSHLTRLYAGIQITYRLRRRIEYLMNGSI